MFSFVGEVVRPLLFIYRVPEPSCRDSQKSVAKQSRGKAYRLLSDFNSPVCQYLKETENVHRWPLGKTSLTCLWLCTKSTILANILDAR